MRSPPLYFTSFCTVPNYCVPSPLLTCCVVPYWYQLICHDAYQNMFRYNVIGQEVGKLSFRLYGKNMVAIVIINKNDLSCIISTRWGSSTPAVCTACCPCLGWHQETCLEARFNLHRPTICLITLKAEGFTVLQVYAKEMSAWFAYIPMWVWINTYQYLLIPFLVGWTSIYQ